MAADVKPIAFILISPADPADQARIRFQHHAGLAVLGQLVRRGEAGGTPAGDHGLVGGYDRKGLSDLQLASSDGGSAQRSARSVCCRCAPMTNSSILEVDDPGSSLPPRRAFGFNSSIGRLPAWVLA